MWNVSRLLKHQMNNVFGGPLTFYLITTAWLAANSGNEGPGIFDRGALVMALAIGISLFILGVRVMNGRAEGQAGVPIGMYFLWVRYLCSPRLVMFACWPAEEFRAVLAWCVTLADVFWTVHRDRFLLPRSAAGVSRSDPKAVHSSAAGDLATLLTDLLGSASEI